MIGKIGHIGRMGLLSKVGSGSIPLSKYWGERLSFWSDGTTANNGTELVNRVTGGSNAILTNNLATNGAMEDDWNPFLTDTNAPATNERSTTQVHGGTYSRHIVLNNAGQTGIQTQRFATKTGETVTVKFWNYKISGAAYLKYAVRRGDGTAFIATGNSTEFTNGWRETTITYTETAGGTGAYLTIYVSAGSGLKEFYIDDYSITVSTPGNIAVTMPFSAESAALDSSGLLYHSSGFGITRRMKAYTSMEGVNKSVFLYPSGNIFVSKAQLSNAEYSKLLNDFDYGQLLFDSLENVVSVKADGTGDYLSIPAALTGIAASANYLNRYRIDLYDNVVLTQAADYGVTYGNYHWYFDLKDHTYLLGVGGGKTITGSLPASASDNESTYYEIAAYNSACGVKDVNFSMKNGRYACHIDNSLGAGKRQEFYNCTFRHLGNQEIINYRIANSLAYAAVNSGTNAIGMGSYSGQTTIFKDCKAYAIHPMAWHTNVNFTSPSKLLLFNVDLVSQPIFNTLYNPQSEVLYSFRPNSLTSRVTNRIEIYRGSINGGISYSAEYYEATATNLYILDDIDIYQFANNGTYENVATTGGALRITSSTPAGSVTNIAGTGATALTSDTCDYASNHATGRLEVGEWSYNANVKMGVRLGNCSVVNKTMTLNVDGAAKTITFNQNFTAQTNAQVLAFINAALAGSATASLYQRASENIPTILT